MLSFPFNAEEDEFGEPDRTYDASYFMDNQSLFLVNGVYPKPPEHMRIKTLQSRAIGGMVVTLESGAGFVNGATFVLFQDEDFAIDESHLTLARRDSIVLRLDKIARTLAPHYVPGTPSLNPTRSTLARTDDRWELLLCEITIPANAQQVTQANILDTRPSTELCGFVTGRPISVDTEDIFLQYETFLNEQIAMWKARHGQQAVDWQEQMTQQQADFNARYIKVRDLIGMLETQTFDIVNHDFDADWNKRGCIYQRDADNFFRETWTVTATDMLLAERTTTFDNGLMQIHTKFYPWEMVEGNTTVKTLAWEQTRNLLDWATMKWEVV